MDSTDQKCEATMENFYGFVINDVIEKSRETFYEECIELDVLADLKLLWTRKMQTALKAVSASRQASTSATVPSYSTSLPQLPLVKQEPIEGLEDVKPVYVVPILIKILANPPFEIRVNVTQAQLDGNRVAKLLTADLLAKLVKMTTEDATATMQSIIKAENKKNIWQVDGNVGTSEESDSDGGKQNEYERSIDNSDDDELNDIIDEEDDEDCEPEPDTADDLTDEEVEDTDNLILCQYTNIKRHKNHWKFRFQNAIMIVNGVEYVFQVATGEGIW